MATEAPITTIGTILERLGSVLYRACLPNGKHVNAFLSRPLSLENAEFVPNDRVHLEMTPYDFDQARIAARARTKYDATIQK
jgi:translation initiation factor IF-1